MSQELEECKAQLGAAVAALRESEKVPSSNTCFPCKEGRYQVVCGIYANLTIDVAGDPGVNLEAVVVNAVRADRQLNTGECVLT